MLVLEWRFNLSAVKGAATCQGERKKKLIGKMLSCHRSRRQVRARSVGGFGSHALAACANGLGVGADINQAPGYCQALVQSPQRGSRPTPPKKRQAQTVQRRRPLKSRQPHFWTPSAERPGGC